jgi:hypothetical protein
MIAGTDFLIVIISCPADAANDRASASQYTSIRIHRPLKSPLLSRIAANDGKSAEHNHAKLRPCETELSCPGSFLFAGKITSIECLPTNVIFILINFKL